MAASRTESKAYNSTLRDRQMAQTREFILDAVTVLVADRRADELTNRDIAAAAGVSERTVYRHFPDRASLIEGLSHRMLHLDGAIQRPSFGRGTIDDLPPAGRRLMEVLEQHYELARAEAILNSDPRRFADDTRSNSGELSELLAAELPDSSELEQRRIAAVVRCLVSTQAWLRMREEFGVPGDESGPVVEWVIELIVRELRAGNAPPAR